MEKTVQSTKANPLAKYFRQPAIYMQLPSNGKYWPEDSIELPVTGEIEVYPMTTRDEITLRTPDALMNGSGVVDVIQSCCPNIKNAWKTPNIDIDAILIAIRIASYGEQLDIDTTCPHCSSENKHNLDLHQCLSSIGSPNYDKPLLLDDLKVKLKPQEYFMVNKENSINFEEQKILQALENVEIDEQVRSQEILKSMNRLVEISIEVLSNATEYFELSDGKRITDYDFIKEFYTKIPGSTFKLIQGRLLEITKDGGVPPQNMRCIQCSQEYISPLTFDYANFFGKGF